MGVGAPSPELASPRAPAPGWGRGSPPGVVRSRELRTHSRTLAPVRRLAGRRGGRGVGGRRWEPLTYRGQRGAPAGPRPGRAGGRARGLGALPWSGGAAGSPPRRAGSSRRACRVQSSPRACVRACAPAWHRRPRPRRMSGAAGLARAAGRPVQWTRRPAVRVPSAAEQMSGSPAPRPPARGVPRVLETARGPPARGRPSAARAHPREPLGGRDVAARTWLPRRGSVAAAQSAHPRPGMMWPRSPGAWLPRAHAAAPCSVQRAAGKDDWTAGFPRPGAGLAGGPRNPQAGTPCLPQCLG